MESKNIVGAVVGAGVGAGVGAVLGPIVAGAAAAGPVVGLVVGALAGALAVENWSKQQEQEEQLQQTTLKEKSRQDSSHHASYTGQRQQQTTPRPNNPNPSSPQIQTSPTQRITKQFLVLVVSASQADFLESLQAKRRIDMSDGEQLYEMTKYLWLGSKTEFESTRANISQYSVYEGQESEYDIYLVYIELNQADEGFKSNVNQLDRYDAFRNLADADLEVKFKISPRLQMEAYGNFDVYNR